MIGIITFHESNNCGSMLQCYALQQTLNKYGYDNEVINFSNKAQRHMYALLRKPRNLHDIMYDMGTLAYWRRFKQHYTDYKAFLKNNICVSREEYENGCELKKIGSCYDAYITGSDQVWNTKCPDADDAYYLNFVENKPKIAYAPSFGATNLLDDYDTKDKYAKLLNEVDCLSIRENNGAKWIREMTGREAQVLLDPTMLLKRSDYECLLKDMPRVKEKYIFYYAFSYSDEVNKAVKAIAEKYQLPVYVMDAKNWVKNCRKYGFRLTERSGPLTFLQMLFNAELVLTTSFHGTVFSIIGKKKFWFIDSMMHNKNDDRAGTILGMFGLENRMLFSEELEKKEAMQSIDYIECEQRLEEKRKQSFDYLINSLSSCGIKPESIKETKTNAIT